jgi:hypothetical protein
MTADEARSIRIGDWISYWDEGSRTGKVVKVHLGWKHQWVKVAPMKIKNYEVRPSKRVRLRDVQEVLGRRKRRRKKGPRHE